MKYLISLLLIALVAGLGYLPQQSDFYLIFFLYAPLFGLYLITYRMYTSHHDVLYFIFLSLVLRALLLFAFPNLSDDIYRFLWDGFLVDEGVNPYLHTPTEWLQSLDQQETIYHLLYPHLNSPDYYSIYPPVCQGIFAVCAKMGFGSIYWSSVIMKVIFLIAETTTIYFLLKLVQLLHIPQHRVLLYALNPLIILEFSGNLHFEAIMIMFLTMAFWFYIRQRSKMFSLSMGMAIGTKLLPLMFLPFFLRRFRKSKLLVGLMLLASLLLLLFVPFLSRELVLHLGTSINLYFQKFEFNSSIYYLIRWIGFRIRGYNVIQTAGPLLSIITFLFIIYLAAMEKPKKMQHVFRVLLLSFSVYLFLSTTIHPWYLGIPVLLSVLTHYRYPIFWSALIIGTYINYSYEPYHENLWVVLIEYSIVYFILFLEVFRINILRWLFGKVMDVFKFLTKGK
ncbi:MAG: polyprenol phosphomannose-dependent alpha 1,6 mannosyltransferase MptB [Saprospiraceae bacterium]|nr:polyprenol phosphomannose-dependent alpha 1,6 mannosyltransferase MptB [Saprospiraceae bacterium]